MTFSDALKSISAGGKCKRTVWADPLRWCGYSTFLSYSGGKVSLPAFVFMSTSLAPWTPSQEDITASDWVEVK